MTNRTSKNSRYFFNESQSNIQLKFADPLSLDLAPTIAYKFNKVFRLGGSITYRIAIINETKYKIDIPADMYGYSLFASHNFFKGIFGHLEYERMSKAIMDNDILVRRKWVDGFMVGIGKQYKIFNKLNGAVILMYNTLHNEHSPHPRAWQVKMGFYVD